MSTAGSNRIIRYTLEQEAFNRVKDMIVSQELKPGERIIHDSLAKMLEISRTPVKKALTSIKFHKYIYI
jgi:DNA-binding GntR family transcriptional regulator